MKWYTLDDDKNIVATEDVLEWGRWFERVGFMGRRVQETKLPNGLRISTVFLGTNYNWNDAPPLVFETMVFPVDSFADLDMDRYASWDQAFQGHNRMVAKWIERTAYLRGPLTEEDILAANLEDLIAEGIE